MAINFIIFISLLVICDLCIITTKCAEKQANQSHSKTPRPEKKTMRMLVDLEKGKDMRSNLIEAIRKKCRTDEGTSSARERLTGMNKVEFEPECRKEDTSRRTVIAWTNEQYRALLRLVYTTYEFKGSHIGEEFDWKLITDRWNSERDKRHLTLLRSQTNTLQILMRRAGREFDALHGGGIPWSHELGDTLLKIYFATEQGDKSKHGERMLAEWRDRRMPGYKRLSAAYLLNWADAMLNSAMKFDLDNPRDRNTMLSAQEKVDWKPEHDAFFLKVLKEHPRGEKNRVQNIYKDVLKKYPGAKWLGEQRVYERAKRLRERAKKTKDVDKTTALDESSVPDVAHSKYYSFLDRLNQSSMVQRPHHNDEWIASTSSHPGSSYDNPDLELRLKPYDLGNESPDTNLKLR